MNIKVNIRATHIWIVYDSVDVDITSCKTCGSSVIVDGRRGSRRSINSSRKGNRLNSINKPSSSSIFPSSRRHK